MCIVDIKKNIQKIESQKTLLQIETKNQSANASKSPKKRSNHSSF
jgi:hypothetical protein